MTVPSQRTSREIRSGRMNRRPPSFVVTLFALAIIFALAWTFFLRSASTVPAPVLSGIQGTFTWQYGGQAGQLEGDFSAVSSGNAGGAERPTDGEVASSLVLPQSAYDAAARTESVYGVAGPSVSYRSIIGRWPPLWQVDTPSPLDYQGLAAVVRSAVEDGDHAVGIKPVKDGGRTAWRAAMTLDGTEIELVVDQETGIVTWCSFGGAETFTAEVDWTSPPAAGTSYSVDVPPGTPRKTIKNDTYVYAASPAAAGQTAGYDPLVSDLAPDGFRRMAVATVDAEGQPLRWLTAPDATLRIPPGASGPVIAQVYSRGLSWFTVEQSGPDATRTYGDSLQELLIPPSGRRLSYQETTLQYGALKGATASTWYQESGPSLFVIDAHRAVFVTGALTRQELIAFAEGLTRLPANASP